MTLFSRLLYVMLLIVAAQSTTGFTIEREAELPDDIGLFYPLKGSLVVPVLAAETTPASDADADVSQKATDSAEGAAAPSEAEAEEPPFDPTPTQFNLRFINNRFTLIFLNKDKQVTDGPDIRKLIMQFERMNDENERDLYGMNLKDDLYWQGPRPMEAPLRYKVRLVFYRDVPNPDELAVSQGATTIEAQEIYGFRILNQLAQLNLASDGSRTELPSEGNLAPGYDNEAANDPYAQDDDTTPVFDGLGGLDPSELRIQPEPTDTDGY